MKGIGIKEYGGKAVLEEVSFPTPPLASDEVLIEVKASGVNPVDWKIREGYLKDSLPYELPLILGLDVSGIVKAIGDQVQNFQIGDEVYSRPDIHQHGSYADEIIVKERLVARKPKNISFEEAASLPLVFLTAWQALVDAARVKEGQKVLIHGGSGGIGTIAIQIAKALGATVATTTSKKNTSFVSSLGADIAIAYDEEDFSQVLNSYDVVFDTLGGQILLDSYKILKVGGKLVSIFGGPDDPLPHSDLANKKQVSSKYVFTDPNGRQLDILTQYIEAKKLHPVVSHILPLTVDGVREAHRLSMTERVKGKIVLSTI
ncbi:NADP-dependent oxidoreductase [Bacillus sp. 03113]|uniref:NADP-dependent oxidoreductase n=1 Tax=Bacillus sp. 03113 TaxID=2578211 RepID=UPI001141A846|nr:NADP-dependent oxidoreductase [Bacillus sp. 03113]